MPPLIKILASNLIRLRSERGLTQSELANAAGLTRGAIAKYESGKGGLTLNSISKLASALVVDEMELVSGPELPRSETQAVRASQIAPGPGTAPASPERENDQIRAEIISLLPALDHLELLQLRSEARGLARARAFLQKRSE